MQATVAIALVIVVLLISASLLASRTSGISAEPDRPHPELAAEQAVWVWGPAHAGFALSVRHLKASYRLGEVASLHVAVQNVSNKNLSILKSRNIPYRIALYDATGNPVASTELGKERELRFYNDGYDYYDGYQLMSAGQIINDEDEIDLTKLFHIGKAGHYYVVVMRRIDSNLSRGFLVSNMGMIPLEE